jgi:hypothetical protein
VKTVKTVKNQNHKHFTLFCWPSNLWRNKC